MTEVSMPLANHHPSSRPGMVEDSESGSGSKTDTPDSTRVPSALPQASRTENGRAGVARDVVPMEDEALFVHAKSNRLPPPGSATSAATAILVQESLEEDQTIVIDLTEDRCNLTRRPTANVVNSNKSAYSVRQWSGNACPPPRPFMQDDMLPQLPPPSTSSSLDVQLGQESGSQFLISRMLNGMAGEEDIAATAFPSHEDDEEDGDDNGQGEILEITATVPTRLQQQQQHRHDSKLARPYLSASSHDQVPPPSAGILPSLRQASIDESDDDEDDRNLSSSIPTERYVEKQPISEEEEGWPSLSSPARPPPPINGATAERRSKSLRRGDEPFNLFGSTSKSLSEVVPLPPARYSALSSSVHRLRSTDGYRSLDRRLVRTDTASEAEENNRKRVTSVRARKSKSNDFLDRIDVSSSSNTVRSSRSRAKSKQTPKLSKIEKGLYLGNMEAATDVILLESRSITHIVTLDSVPLPRKISSFLPRISQLHMHVTDLPDEDILSHVTEALQFIRAGVDSGGNVLVHCFRGKSRSATIVLAFIMQKYRYTLEKAMKKIKAKRECINPHEGFLAQLKLYEQMEYDLDPSNVQFKMFKLRLAAERMRKAKVLFRDSLDGVIDNDPGETSLSPGDSLLYKCKRCRRTLATSRNLIPHVRGESPDWHDHKWSLPAEEVLEGAADLGLDLCHPRSVFICPVGWMRAEVRQTLAGRLRCPNCQVHVGAYSWVAGAKCSGCKGVHVVPAFQLDVTEIIFKTKNRFLQSSGREPVVV